MCFKPKQLKSENKVGVTQPIKVEPLRNIKIKTEATASKSPLRLLWIPLMSTSNCVRSGLYLNEETYLNVWKKMRRPVIIYIGAIQDRISQILWFKFPGQDEHSKNTLSQVKHEWDSKHVVKIILCVCSTLCQAMSWCDVTLGDRWYVPPFHFIFHIHIQADAAQLIHVLCCSSPTTILDIHILENIETTRRKMYCAILINSAVTGNGPSQIAEM